MPDVVVVLTTLPADADAGAFARALVEERLAACVNIHGPMTSVYRWEGKVQEEGERQLTMKTTASRMEALRARIQTLHPYEVPEILVLPVVDGAESYLQWVADNS